MYKLWALRFKLLCILLFFTINYTLANSTKQTLVENWLWLALSLLMLGAGFSWIVRRWQLPSVLGELLFGMLLAIFAHYQWWFWPKLLTNPSFALLAELGSILLLFEIGLESSISGLVSVGKYGIRSALLGIIVPFGLGVVVIGMWLLHSNNLTLNLFLGATLAATSTGISLRVFKDLGILKTPAVQIVLASSIIDDILGLIILAFVSGLVIAGSIAWSSIMLTLMNVLIFFVFALLIARRLMPYLIRWLLKISNEEAMIMLILLGFCLFWAWLAHEAGLAAIIGAFVAGLILDEKVFRNTKQPFWYQELQQLDSTTYNDVTTRIIQRHYHQRLSDLVKPINYVLVPIFFIYAGMQVDLIAVASWQILINGLLLSVVAIIGKLACGIGLPKTINPWVVGFGMVPRGEIGLIFALTGRQLGVFNQEIFAAVLLMVVITSVVTPLALQLIIKKRGLNEA